jgi:hypothetical protein
MRAPREQSKELERRGATVARIAAGACRAEPEPADVTREDVGEVTDVLLESGSAALAWHRLRGTPAVDGEAGTVSRARTGGTRHVLRFARASSVR